jgi:hypothetical protein
MGNGAGRDEAGLGLGSMGDLAARLVDKQLDQGARIEIQAQRRPSETYSAAVGPSPLNLTGFGMNGERIIGGLTVPSAIKAARPGGTFAETIVATGLPRRVIVIDSPASTRSTMRLALFFSSRIPTLSLM